VDGGEYFNMNAEVWRPVEEYGHDTWRETVLEWFHGCVRGRAVRTKRIVDPKPPARHVNIPRLHKGSWSATDVKEMEYGK
jgi:hypothetical protein